MRRIEIGILVALGLLLLGCDKEGIYNKKDPGSSATKLSECNRFSGNHTLTGNTKTFYEFGTYRPDKLNLRFTSVPTGFETGANQIQFYRVAVSPSGVYGTPEPLSFYLLYHGTYLNAGNSMTSLDKSFLNQLAKNGSGYPTDVTSYDFVVNRTELPYNVLQISLYTNNSANTYVDHVDELMPAFDANPDTYAAVEPPALQMLHPFNSQRGFTTDQYYSMALSQLCY